MKNSRSGIIYIVATTMFFSNQVFAAPNLKELCAKGLLGDEDCKVVIGAGVTTAAGVAVALTSRPSAQPVPADDQVVQEKLSGAMKEANESKLRLYLQQNSLEGSPESDVIPVSRRAPHLPGSPEFENAYNSLNNHNESYKLDVVLKGEMAQQEAARVALANATKMDIDVMNYRSEIAEEMEATEKFETRRRLLTEVNEAMDKHLNSTKNGSAVVNTGDLIGSLRAKMTPLEKILEMGDRLTPAQETQLKELRTLRTYLANLPRTVMSEASLKQGLNTELSNVTRSLEYNRAIIVDHQEQIEELTKKIADKKVQAEQYKSGQLVVEENMRTSFYKVGDRLFQVVDKEGTLVEIDGRSATHLEKMRASGSTPTALIKFNTKNSRTLSTSVRARSGGMIVGAIGLGVLIEELAVGGIRHSQSVPSASATKVQPATIESARVSSTK